MKAIAPGKLILSGEHSVVYGAPAMAVAVDRHVTASFTPSPSDVVTIQSQGFGEFTLLLEQLQPLYKQLNQRFDAYLSGDTYISQLLQSPGDLLFYSLAHYGFNQAGVIKLSSTIPLGAGMGSSAAVIAALLRMTLAITGQTKRLPEFVDHVRYCERLQHGKGSAIDASAIGYGGVVKVQGDQCQGLDLSLGSDWYIWNSGTPISTTGETVAAVRGRFAESPIWHEFASVTNAIEQALHVQQSQDLLLLLKQNQQLLSHIGVVPKTIQNRIAEIEKVGGAAKICGAGSIEGDAAGLMLCYLPDLDVRGLAKQLNIDLTALQVSREGAHLAAN